MQPNFGAGGAYNLSRLASPRAVYLGWAGPVAETFTRIFLKLSHSAMILSDILFGDDDQTNDQGQKNQSANQNPTNSVGPKNEELEAEREYKRDQSNNKDSDDASAHRNVGANGYTQRSDQKDQLQNLHIGGSETEPQGGNNHETANETAQGPGFTEEGSYELDEQGEGIRMHEQKLGDDHTSESVQRPQDERL